MPAHFIEIARREHCGTRLWFRGTPSIGVGRFEKKGRLTMTKARVRAFLQTCLAMAALLPFAAAGSRAWLGA